MARETNYAGWIILAAFAIFLIGPNVDLDLNAVYCTETACYDGYREDSYMCSTGLETIKDGQPVAGTLNDLPVPFRLCNDKFAVARALLYDETEGGVMVGDVVIAKGDCEMASFDAVGFETYGCSETDIECGAWENVGCGKAGQDSIGTNAVCSDHEILRKEECTDGDDTWNNYACIWSLDCPDDVSPPSDPSALKIVSIKAPSTIIAGRTATIKVDVKNYGSTQTETERVEVGIYAEGSNALMALVKDITNCFPSEEFVETQSIAGLDAGETQTMTFEIEVPDEDSILADGSSNWNKAGDFIIRAAILKCCYEETGCSYPFYTNKAGDVGVTGGVMKYKGLVITATGGVIGCNTDADCDEGYECKGEKGCVKKFVIPDTPDWLKENWMYLTIGFGALIIIIILMKQPTKRRRRR